MSEQQKKTRTPRTSDSITKGALSLPLKDKVALVKELQSSIDDEVKAAKEAAALAEQIANS